MVNKVEHRTKTYMINWLKNTLAFLEPGALNLSDDFVVKYHLELNNGAVISVKDPTDGITRFFEITVKQRAGELKNA